MLQNDGSTTTSSATTNLNMIPAEVLINQYIHEKVKKKNFTHASAILIVGSYLEFSEVPLVDYRLAFFKN